jgi:predicted DNA-binding transcriptional regulator AlpA
METECLTMTLPEFARATGISKNLAYSLAATDSLPVPVIKLGRRLLLSRKAVSRFLDGEKTKGG